MILFARELGAPAVVLGILAGVVIYLTTRSREYRPDEQVAGITSSLANKLPPDAPKPLFTDVTHAAGLASFRNFIGPRVFESTGLPLHADNQTIVKERIYLEKDNPDVLHDIITTIDHALTRPWTVDRLYMREHRARWKERNCHEANNHVVVGSEHYFLSADGKLMPVKADQSPPDLRYFKPSPK
jgi:hypothetical protein